MTDKLVSEKEQQENDILLKDYDGSTSRTSTETDFDESFTFDSPQKRRWITSIKCQLTKLSQSLVSSSQLLLLLLPSFIYPWNSAPKTLHPTAYLDGLRGVAALFVAFHHYTCQFTPALLEGWGSGISEENIASNYWVFQLPLIRIIHSGQFMVVLFYVMSGCVLSARGLKLARSGKQSEFASSIASSVFRRWIRLHLPVIAAMFIAFLISRCEGWDHLQPDWLAPIPAPIADTNPTTVGEEETARVMIRIFRPAVLSKRVDRFVWWIVMAPKMESLKAQVWQWIYGVMDVCDPFRYGLSPTAAESLGYNAGLVLWTIPAEWLGSMVVFLVVLGLAWVRAVARLGLILMLTSWCHYTGKWEVASFLSGTLIAELILIRNARVAARTGEGAVALVTDNEERGGVPSTSKRGFVMCKEMVVTVFWISLFVIGAFLGSHPFLNANISPGFITLWSWIPTWYQAPERFYLCIGGFFIIVSITHCVALQRVFMTRSAQYLGRISFSLYLVHAQILLSMGIGVMTSMMKFVGGGEGQVTFALGWALGSVVMALVTIWAADIFCRAVDEQSVNFGRWLAEKFLCLDE